MPLPIWGFVAVTAPLVLSPGPSTAVVLRNSIAAGARGGFFTALGANSGSMCYGLLVAFGFAAAIQRWPWVWLVLRWGGVAYLTWLGIQSLRRAFRVRPAVAGTYTPPPREWWQSFGSGFATNVLNPSLAAFYLIVLPQFVPRGTPFTSAVMTLTAIHVGMAFSWHLAWALAVAEGMEVMRIDGLRKAAAGTTSIAELLRVVA